MKTFFNFCIVIIYFLGATTVSFHFIKGGGSQFLIASEYGYLFHYVALAITFMSGFIANFLTKTQLLGLGIFLTAIPFSMYGTESFISQIILDHHPVVGITMFLTGVSLLVFRSTLKDKKNIVGEVI